MQNIFKSLYQKKTKYYELFFSYLSILIVLIFISSFIHFISIRVIESEIDRANNNTLNQMRIFYERDFENIQGIVYSIFRLSNVEKLMNSKDIYTSSQMSDMSVDIIRNIFLYQNNMDNIKSCLLVFDEKDLCYDDSGKYSKQIAFNHFFSSYYATKEAWLTDMDITSAVHEYKILTGNKNERKVLYIQKYPIIGNRETKATIIVELDSQIITDNMKKLSDENQGQVYILDSKNQMLFGTDQWHGYDFIPGVSGALSRDGRAYVYTSVKSDNLDMTYIYMLPSDVHTKSIRKVHSLAIYIYILCGIIGLCIALFFSKRNYIPIMKLVDKIQRSYKLNTGVSSDETEFTYIENAINEIFENKKMLELESENQKNKLREVFFTKLLQGKIKFDNLSDKTFLEYGLSLNSEYYVCVLFTITDLGIVEDDDGSINWENYNRVQFLISNVYGELLSDNSSHFCEIEDMYACIIHSPHSAIEIIAAEKAKEALEFFKKNFDILFTCAISGIDTGISALPLLFEQAKEATMHRFLLCDSFILRYTEITSESQTGFEYTPDTEHKLVSAIKRGSFAEAKQIIEDIFNFSQKSLDFNFARILSYDVLSTVLKLSNNLSISKNQIEIIKNIEKSDTINRSKNEILLYVEELCCNIKEESTACCGKIDAILSYIHENYANIDLNVSMIADTFGLTISYLSRYFKEQTGQGTADYIVKYRINKSINILKLRRTTIAETGRQCGFYSANVFIRAFKKLNGITPGEYVKSLGSSLE